MFAMEGIPAIYIHSFLGTKNDHKAIAAGEGNRSINRFKWDKKDIFKILEDKNSNNFYIMSKLNSLLNINHILSKRCPSKSTYLDTLFDG